MASWDQRKDGRRRRLTDELVRAQTRAVVTGSAYWKQRFAAIGRTPGSISGAAALESVDRVRVAQAAAHGVVDNLLDLNLGKSARLQERLEIIELAEAVNLGIGVDKKLEAHSLTGQTEIVLLHAHEIRDRVNDVVHRRAQVQFLVFLVVRPPDFQLPAVRLVFFKRSGIENAVHAAVEPGHLFSLEAIAGQFPVDLIDVLQHRDVPGRPSGREMPADF